MFAYTNNTTLQEMSSSAVPVFLILKLKQLQTPIF